MDYKPATNNKSTVTAVLNNSKSLHTSQETYSKMAMFERKKTILHSKTESYIHEQHSPPLLSSLYSQQWQKLLFVHLKTILRVTVIKQ